MRGARIEKAFWWIQTGRIRSLPIQRARIENTGAHDTKGADYVAPHTGSEN